MQYSCPSAARIKMIDSYTTMRHSLNITLGQIIMPSSLSYHTEYYQTFIAFQWKNNYQGDVFCSFATSLLNVTIKSSADMKCVGADDGSTACIISVWCWLWCSTKTIESWPTFHFLSNFSAEPPVKYKPCEKFRMILTVNRVSNADPASEHQTPLSITWTLIAVVGEIDLIYHQNHHFHECQCLTSLSNLTTVSVLYHGLYSTRPV